jgi:hypothetical protein
VRNKAWRIAAWSSQTPGGNADVARLLAASFRIQASISPTTARRTGRTRDRVGPACTSAGTATRSRVVRLPLVFAMLLFLSVILPWFLQKGR